MCFVLFVVDNLEYVIIESIRKPYFDSILIEKETSIAEGIYF